MRCIICGKEKAESDEHIIPEALGNKKLITKRVCEYCNNQLGAKADIFLTDHALVKIIRMELELSGKKGKDIKLFDGVEIDVNTGARYSMKNNIPSLLPRVVEADNNDQYIKYTVEAKTISEGISHFEKYMKRKGFSDEKIKEWCDRAIFHKEELAAPVFEIDASIDFAKLDFAAIKIAYEYAFEKLGEAYLDDPIAKKFAEELYKTVQEEKKSVTISGTLAKYVTYPIQGSGIEKLLADVNESLSHITIDPLHLVFWIQQDNSLYCVLHLCMTEIITFVVRVTDHADLYSGKHIITLVLKDGQVLEF